MLLTYTDMYTIIAPLPYFLYLHQANCVRGRPELSVLSGISFGILLMLLQVQRFAALEGSSLAPAERLEPKCQICRADGKKKKPF